MLSVDDGLKVFVLEEAVEDCTGLLEDVRRDAFDFTSTCESVDSMIGDAEGEVS